LNVTPPVTTTLAVAIEPVVDPDPIDTAPAETVNAPVNVFVPVNVNVPVPCLVSLPFVPSITPAKVVVELPAVVSVFDALLELNVILAAESLVFTVSIDATVSSYPPSENVPEFPIDTADVSAILFAAPIARTPAVTVVVPVYVFVDAPEYVNVPAPCFVTPNEPDTTPDIVADLPVATPTVEVDPSVTAPDNSALSEKYTAPFVDVVPFSVKGSANVTAPASSRVAPAVMDAP
jgi:hypothetical protein